MGDDTFEAQRLEHQRLLQELLPAEIAKRAWSPQQFRDVRVRRLQELVAHAQQHSPWHAERLRGIDARDIDERSLAQLPTMSKADLMANWDDIVCDRRVTLRAAEDAIEGAAQGRPSYLFGEYLAIASGGSSGKRGVFVWDRAGLARGVALAVRFQRWVDDDLGAAAPPRIAYVQATSPSHASNLVARCFGDPARPQLHLSPSTPTDEAVSAINHFAPTQLVGYPSALHVLAQEAAEGRLRAPIRRIQCQAEPVAPETRSLLEEAFGAPVTELYGASECANLGQGWPGETWLRQAEDHAVIEASAQDGATAAVGQPSARMFVTNAINRALPLIRYDLGDEITYLEDDDHPTRPGRRFRVAGRCDDLFRYGAVTVHPHVLRSVLGRRDIAEYQVRQTPGGVEVDLRALAPVAVESIANDVGEALQRAGLGAPSVAVRALTSIERNAATGKLKRFVPLP